MLADHLRAVSGSFKVKTLAVVGWYPKHFEFLTNDALESLSVIYALVET